MSVFHSRIALALFLQIAAAAIATDGARADTGFRRQIGEGAIAFELEVTQAPAADRAGTAVLRLTARSAVSGGTLEIVAGGSLAVEAAAPFESGTVRPSYFPDLAVTSRLAREIGPLQVGETRSETLTLRSRGGGRGYLAATSTTKLGSDRDRSIDSATLYGVSDGARTFLSKQGFLDAQVLQLKAQQQEPGSDPAVLERRIRQLKRGGGSSLLEIRQMMFPLSGLPGLGGPAALEPLANATIRGQIRFTDVAGRQHPVRHADIDVVEERNGAETVLASVKSDQQGRYAVSIPIPAGAAKDIFVLAKASGETVRVVEFDGGDQWSVASATSSGVRAGSLVALDVTASNSGANNLAFEVYEAINYASRYVGTLAGALPRSVTVSFPKPLDDGSFYQNNVLTLAGTDAHDWDNILHEYGHHLQSVFDLANSDGGQHSTDENLCRSQGKDRGIRLAWGEGWPTFFGTMLQMELKLGTLGIPNVGDTRYTDTKPNGQALEYDLAEGQPSPTQIGEGNELAVQRVLWEMYDRRSNADAVTFSAADLWKVAQQAKPRHMSALWQAFMTGKSGKMVSDIGAVTAAHGLASRPLSPASGETLPRGVDVELQWSAANHCADTGRAEYSVRFYGADMMAPVFSTPFASGTSVRVNADELRNAAGPDGKLIWAVVARDKTPPATGEFHGPIATARLLADGEADVASNAAAIAPMAPQQAGAAGVPPLAAPAAATLAEPTRAAPADAFADACRARLTDVQEARRLCVLAIVEDARKVRVVQATGASAVGRVLEVFEGPPERGPTTPLRSLDGLRGRLVVIGGAENGDRIFKARMP
jgi:hypothetical protein